MLTRMTRWMDLNCPNPDLNSQKKLIFIHAEEKCRIGEQNPTTLAGDGNKNLV